MTLRHASLMWICTCLLFVVATESARVLEARQGPISTVAQPLPSAPGPVSLDTSSSTSTTMPPASSTTTLHSSSTTTSHSSSVSPTSSSHSASATSSATPQPSSSPGVLSLTVNNMTTCTSGLISWKYSGNQAGLLLSITNTGVDQYYALPRIKSRDTITNTIQQQLVDTNTSLSSWVWSSVNITQGWYEIQGLVLTTPTVNNSSAPFFITNGTDVTCLTGVSPATSSGVSSSLSSSGSSLNVAGIAGGVVGAIVGVALVIVLGLCLWSRKRKRSLVGGSKSGSRNWGSLKSTVSSVQPGEGGTQFTRDRLHAHSESTRGILEDVAGGKPSAAITPGDSEEDTVTMGEEKLISSASSSGMSPFEVLNTPAHYDRRTSAYHSVQLPTPVTSESSRSRSASLHTSTQSIEQQAQRIRSSMEISTQRRSGRLSMPTLPSPVLSRLPHSPTHTQHKEEYPLSPVAATPVGRSISAGAVSATARRASRKPVPQYDPSVLLEDTNTDSVSTFTAGAESSQSHGTGRGTATPGTPADLVHKASFGDGRPMHYLIPDMPLPQQD